jgi:hypothetical protein
MKLKVIYKSGAEKLMLVPIETTVIEFGKLITVPNDLVAKIVFL